jgi:TnpA family transposase
MVVCDGVGFAMCPRLKALKDRHLYLPRGCEVPEILKPICEASLDLSQVPTHWDPWVRLLASVYCGHTNDHQRDGTFWFCRTWGSAL